MSAVVKNPIDPENMPEILPGAAYGTLVTADGDLLATIARGHSNAREISALIATAINAHEPLVKALMQADREMSALEEHFVPTESDRAAIDAGLRLKAIFGASRAKLK